MSSAADHSDGAAAGVGRSDLSGSKRQANSRRPAVSPSSMRTTSSNSNGAAQNAGMRGSLASRVLAPASYWVDDMQWTRKKKHKLSKKASLELVLSYAPDWVLTILTAGLLQLLDKIYGFRRQFSLTDTSLQHTYAVHERVSVGLLAVLAFVIPVILIGGVSLGISRSVWDFHAGVLGLVVAHALTLTATTIIKVSVGRPRPDIIDRCQPRAGAMDAVPYGLVTDAICTTDPHSHLLTDGFRSFPSGHSSTAFAGLTFLTLWFAGKVHFWQRGHGSAASAWLLFTPMFGAAMIAVSRTMDYRHHATDVIAGGILGFVIAVSTYHNYYPPLWNTESQKPWSPRTSAVRRWRAAARHAQDDGNGLASALPLSYERDTSDDEAAAAHFAIQDDDGRVRRTRKPSLGVYSPATNTYDTESERYPLAQAPGPHASGHEPQAYPYDASSSGSHGGQQPALQEVVIAASNARN